MPQPVSAWQAEFAARYWFGEAKTGKTSTVTPSVFERDGVAAHLSQSADEFRRALRTHGRQQWLVPAKAMSASARSRAGTLQDEDFPSPGFSPYSSTTSEQHNGYLSYANINVGYDVLRGGDFNLGAFAGYFLFKEDVNAFGCTQTAGNPDVCQPAVPTRVEVISQTNIWQSPRLGVGGSIVFAERFKFSADAAWLPYVRLNGADTHWLRIGGGVGDFAGPIPEDGIGMGYQLEAVFSYDVTPNASVGVGARYWHLQTNGNSHFENLIVGEERGRSRLPGKPIFTACSSRAATSSALIQSASTDDPFLQSDLGVREAGAGAPAQREHTDALSDDEGR